MHRVEDLGLRVQGLGPFRVAADSCLHPAPQIFLSYCCGPLAPIRSLKLKGQLDTAAFLPFLSSLRLGVRA